MNGKKVQIKGTQGKDSIVIREEPEYLLVEYLDKETGTIRINKLLELDANVLDEERIHAVVPIEKYSKSNMIMKSVETRQIKRKVGKTLIEGYINKNNQENRGCLNKPGNHAHQMAYLLHCNKCGFEYEANGCDVAIRKCPRCM